MHDVRAHAHAHAHARAHVFVAERGTDVGDLFVFHSLISSLGIGHDFGFGFDFGCLHIVI